MAMRGSRPSTYFLDGAPVIRWKLPIRGTAQDQVSILSARSARREMELRSRRIGEHVERLSRISLNEDHNLVRVISIERGIAVRVEALAGIEGAPVGIIDAA